VQREDEVFTEVTGVEVTMCTASFRIEQDGQCSIKVTLVRRFRLTNVDVKSNKYYYIFWV
jgi:hypothetical protein